MANKGLIVGGVGIAALIAFLAFGKSASAAPKPAPPGGGGGGGGGGEPAPTKADCTTLANALISAKQALSETNAGLDSIDGAIANASSQAELDYYNAQRVQLVNARNLEENQVNQIQSQLDACKAGG